MDGVILTPLDIIKHPSGNILHGIKSSEASFVGFGEAYFSKLDSKAIKGWKLHKKMTLNLVVPIGSVRFILLDNRSERDNTGQFQEVILDEKSNYSRLTIPPMIWVGFQGISQTTSLVLNLANIEHSTEEIKRKELEDIKFNWS